MASDRRCFTTGCPRPKAKGGESLYCSPCEREMRRARAEVLRQERERKALAQSWAQGLEYVQWRGILMGRFPCRPGVSTWRRLWDKGPEALPKSAPFWDLDVYQSALTRERVQAMKIACKRAARLIPYRRLDGTVQQVPEYELDQVVERSHQQAKVKVAAGR